MLALTRYLSTFRALSGREQKVLLASIVLLPVFWSGLRIAGLQRFQTWLGRFQIGGGNSISHSEAAALGVAVNRAASRVLGPSCCLTRSLMLWWWLRRYGMNSDLCIGVRFESGELRAHAWVALGGIPINDRPDVVAQYAAFDQPVSPDRFV
mgnify:CR=1 FL=1